MLRVGIWFLGEGDGCWCQHAVQPVAILSAEFWIVRSLFMCVGDTIGDQDQFAYPRMGRVIVLKLVVKSYCCFPHCVTVRDLIILMVLSALL